MPQLAAIPAIASGIAGSVLGGAGSALGALGATGAASSLTGAGTALGGVASSLGASSGLGGTLGALGLTKAAAGGQALLAGGGAAQAAAAGGGAAQAAGGAGAAQAAGGAGQGLFQGLASAAPTGAPTQAQSAALSQVNPYSIPVGGSAQAAPNASVSMLTEGGTAGYDVGQALKGAGSSEAVGQAGAAQSLASLGDTVATASQVSQLLAGGGGELPAPPPAQLRQQVPTIATDVPEAPSEGGGKINIQDLIRALLQAQQGG